MKILFNKRKSIYLSLMIISFICFNIENVQATEVSSSIPVQVLPSLDGTNHLSDTSSGNPPVLDDIVSIGNFYEHLKNDYVDLSNKVSAKKKEEFRLFNYS